MCPRPARQATLVIVLSLVVTIPLLAQAEQRPGPIAEIAVGSLLFADDVVVREEFLGAAGRLYLSPRISVGPEVAFILGENHNHFMLTGNFTCDLLAPVNGRSRRVTPFLVAGGGLFQTRQQFFNESFTHTEGAFTAGGGARVRLGDRVTAGVDARLGWELHLRLNALVGVRLGRD